MFRFLFRVLSLVKPYKGRLALGILCGVLSALANPLLMASVKLVTEVAFPPAASSVDARSSEALRQSIAQHRKAADRLDQEGKAQEAIEHRVIIENLEKSLSTGKEDRRLAQLPGWARRGLEDLQKKIPAVRTDNKFVVGLVILMVPLAMFLRVGFAYLNIYFMQWVSIRAIADLRTKLFSHLVNLSLQYFNRVSTGELIMQVNNVQVVQSTISNSLSVIIKEPITVLALMAYLIYQQPRLTLVAMLVFPLCIVPVVYYGRKVKKSTEKFQFQSVGMGKLMHETFTGNRIIKAYNLEGTVIDQFVKTSREHVGHFMRMVRGSELPGPMIEFCGSIGVALFLFYIAATGEKTPGDFLSFVGSLFLMYAPIKQITRLHSQLVHAQVVGDQVFKIIDTKTAVPDPVNPVPLNPTNHEVAFENISFKYDDKLVLKNLNLTVKAGQMVALVGSSGSGKTTITNLLLRFYDPQEGRITVGGIDIRTVTQKDLRNKIAVVTQDTVLFNESIAYNIALGKPKATPREISEAARHAHALDFINDKPRKFNMVVGEKGTLLSGGQKQRIAIARAILKDAPILVLDEATNALDAESERAVQAALEELMKGRTTICIAHRLSTIQKADAIVVMSEGRIVEIGTHTELLASGGHYRKLHDLQFRT